MKHLKFTHFITVASAVCVMLLPWGAVLRFVSQTETGYQQEVLKTYSYFDMTVYGYANCAPLLCAVTSLVLALLLCCTLFKNENIGFESKPICWAMTALSAIALMLSLLPLILYGFKFFNMTALMISFLLACSVIISLHRLTGKLFVSEEAEDEE